MRRRVLLWVDRVYLRLLTALGYLGFRGDGRELVEPGPQGEPGEATLPADPGKGWAKRAVPLPAAAGFVQAAEGLASRSAVWASPEPIPKLRAFYREETGLRRLEGTDGDGATYRVAEDTRLRVREDDSGVSLIGVVQEPERE